MSEVVHEWLRGSSGRSSQNLRTASQVALTWVDFEDLLGSTFEPIHSTHLPSLTLTHLAWYLNASKGVTPADRICISVDPSVDLLPKEAGAQMLVGIAGYMSLAQAGRRLFSILTRRRERYASLNVVVALLLKNLN